VEIIFHQLGTNSLGQLVVLLVTGRSWGVCGGVVACRAGRRREMMLFIGTRFSNLYT